MADEKEGGKLDEGVASSFVSVLGLTDIFFGALLLYAISVRARPTLSRVFPPTGNAVADLVLLTSAAALAGKIVSLVATWILAIADQLMEKSGKARQLRAYLSAWRERTERPALDAQDLLPIDAAMKTLRFDAPALAREDARTAKSAEIAMGGALLAFVYAWAISGAGTSLLRWGFGLGALGLFALALVSEADYIGELRDSVGALRERKPPESEGHE